MPSGVAGFGASGETTSRLTVTSGPDPAGYTLQTCNRAMCASMAFTASPGIPSHAMVELPRQPNGSAVLLRPVGASGEDPLCVPGASLHDATMKVSARQVRSLPARKEGRDM